jgi:DNA-binding NarL/FixJ family response regulator
MTVRIVIAEDHAVLCATLRALLDVEPDLEVVGEAANAGEVLCLIDQLRPDVVLLDLVLPDLQGFHTVCQVSRTLPTAHLLLLVDDEDVGVTREALLAGAAGCVVIRAAMTTLVCAVRAVAQGQLYIQPSVMRALLADWLPYPAWLQQSADRLTPREVDVVYLIAQGYTNREVAKTLGLSVRTVESHRENIMTKLGLHSRAELVRYAAARRLVHLPH